MQQPDPGASGTEAESDYYATYFASYDRRVSGRTKYYFTPYGATQRFHIVRQSHHVEKYNYFDVMTHTPFQSLGGLAVR